MSLLTERLFYFDPDVVIKTDWSFLESWATKGVALCLDNCFQLMPYNHPWRHEWIKIGERIGLSLKTQQNFYCNAGFLASPDSMFPFLELWTDLTDSYRDSDGDVATMKKVSRTSAVVGDQDLLNAAMMYTDVPLSIIGPEGMDFGGGGYLMSHAVYNIKPWKRRFLAELIRSGNIPSSADKEFMKNISSPIKVFPVGEERFKKVDMKLASVLGRLIGH